MEILKALIPQNPVTYSEAALKTPPLASSFMAKQALEEAALKLTGVAMNAFKATEDQYGVGAAHGPKKAFEALEEHRKGIDKIKDKIEKLPEIPVTPSPTFKFRAKKALKMAQKGLYYGTLAASGVGVATLGAAHVIPYACGALGATGAGIGAPVCSVAVPYAEMITASAFPVYKGIAEVFTEAGRTYYQNRPKLYGGLQKAVLELPSAPNHLVTLAGSVSDKVKMAYGFLKTLSIL